MKSVAFGRTDEKHLATASAAAWCYWSGAIINGAVIKPD